MAPRGGEQEEEVEEKEDAVHSDSCNVVYLLPAALTDMFVLWHAIVVMVNFVHAHIAPCCMLYITLILEDVHNRCRIRVAAMIGTLWQVCSWPNTPELPACIQSSEWQYNNIRVSFSI